MNLINVTYGDSILQLPFGLLTAIIYIGILIVLLAGLWNVFVKADKPGWAIFVPFYGNYCEFDIAFGCGWLFLLMFIPLVKFVVMILMYFKLAKAFGKGIGFGFGLLLLPVIFVPMLGFGSTKYIGPR